MLNISKLSGEDFDNVITEINTLDSEIDTVFNNHSSAISSLKNNFDSSIATINTTLSNKIESSELLNLLFPIGSCYITKTNVAPAIGGTWTLIDKNFTPQTLNTSLFTINTTNVTSLSSCVAFLGGKSIRVRLGFVNKVALGDTTLEIGTLNLAKIGITSINVQLQLTGYTDAGNSAPIAHLVTSTGVLNHLDSIGLASIAAGNTIYYDFTIPVKPSNMVDSFCNSFIWKRTA